MAIAIPFVASAMGASALQATLISVAFSVTGISAKIDKAASKVFGKDLVMFANVLGAGYAMFNGGFNIGAGGDAASAASMNVPTGSEAGDLFQSQMSAQGIEPSAFTGAEFNLNELGAEQLTNDAWNTMGDANSSELTEFAPKDGVVNAMTGEGGNVDSTLKLNDPQAPADMNANAAPVGQSGTGAAGQQATASGATANNATASTATGSNATASTMTADQAAQMQKDIAAAQKAAGPSNIFERMFYTTDKAGNRIFNDRLAGGVIQGVGSAASGYMQSRDAAKGLEWQKQKYGARIGGRVTG